MLMTVVAVVVAVVVVLMTVVVLVIVIVVVRVDLAADAERVAVRVADVHLAHAPRLVPWRHGHLDALRETHRVHRVDVVNPDRDPGPVLAATALATRAQENLDMPRAHR